MHVLKWQVDVANKEHTYQFCYTDNQYYVLLKFRKNSNHIILNKSV